MGYDWFDSSHNGAIALYGNGRVSMQNRTVNNVGNNVPYLFETYFTLTDTTSPVTNIVVKYYSAPSGSSTTYVMAISASADGVAPVIISGPSPATQSWFEGQTATFSVEVNGTRADDKHMAGGTGRIFCPACRRSEHQRLNDFWLQHDESGDQQSGRG
ncbi:MAG: hypothetical protein WDM76_07800 [Limisphaerales bacterium]